VAGNLSAGDRVAPKKAETLTAFPVRPLKRDGRQERPNSEEKTNR
jgi:hypothetical protein